MGAKERSEDVANPSCHVLTMNHFPDSAGARFVEDVPYFEFDKRGTSLLPF